MRYKCFCLHHNQTYISFSLIDRCILTIYTELFRAENKYSHYKVPLNSALYSYKISQLRQILLCNVTMISVVAWQRISQIVSISTEQKLFVLRTRRRKYCDRCTYTGNST